MSRLQAWLNHAWYGSDPPRWWLAPGAALYGAVFALGWTPCLGPTLTGVITVASATQGANVARGIVLVIAYCLGLGIPFVLLAFGSARAGAGFGWLRRHSRAIQIFGGAVLIVVGARYRAATHVVPGMPGPPGMPGAPRAGGPGAGGGGGRGGNGVPRRQDHVCAIAGEVARRLSNDVIPVPLVLQETVPC